MYFKYINISIYFMYVLILCNGDNIIHDPCDSEKYQSDIAIPENIKAPERNRRAVTNDQSKIWEDGIIPYEISKSFNGRETVLIHKAIAHWHMKTCLIFKRRTVEKEYVIFRKQAGCGCCSFVGRMGEGKPQAVNLDKKCLKYGTILHEIGHVVGFWHEHTRPDRDLFLKIQTEHILKEELKNFEKKSPNEINSLGVPYDYGSLMHYGKNTFSKSLMKNSILPIRHRDIEIGQREALSAFDAKQTNLLYACATHQKTFTDPFGELQNYAESNHEQPNNARIVAPEGHQIFLYFQKLNLSSTCDRCQIALIDGNEVRHSYCRDNRPPNVYLSKKNHLSVQLSSVHFESPTCGYVAKYNVLCGGNIEDNIGYIQSPGYPSHYDSNRICEWNIKVEKGLHIEFNFEILKLERTPTCDKDYIEIIDVGSNRNLGRFCRYRDVKRLRTTSNLAKLRFRSNGHNNKQGFSMKFYTVLNPCGKDNGGCSQLCMPINGNAKCSCYEGYRLDDDQKTCTPACNKSITLIPGQYGDMIVPYKTHGNVPIICQWVIHGFPGYSVVFKIANQNIHQSDGNIVDFFGVGPSKPFKSKSYRVSFDNEKVNLPFRTVIVKAYLKKTNIRYLHIASFSLEKNECLVRNGGCQHICKPSNTKAICYCRFGYVLAKDMKSCIAGNSLAKINKVQGYITSPDFPRFYVSTKSCQWDFSTVPGHRAIFHLQDLIQDDLIQAMQTDPSRCPLVYKDQMTRESRQICKKGGKWASKSHLSSILFQQSYDKYLVKFNISYSTECGGELLASKKYQHIYSHLSYQEKTNYPNQVKCQWSISHPNKKYRILLNFKSFNLENEPCRFDYVSIYDGASSESPLIARLCGSKLKNNIFVSSTNKVTVQFISDQSVSGRGFHLSYKRTRAKSTMELKARSKKSEKNKFGRRRDFFVFDVNKISSS